MEPKIHIWKTVFDSIKSTFQNLDSWIKLATGPLLLAFLSIVFGAVIAGLAGPFEHNPLPEFLQKYEFEVFLGALLMIPGLFLATNIFYKNALRYAMLGEGGKSWFQLGFDRHLWRLIGYELLMLLIVLGLILAGGILAGLSSMIDKKYLPIIVFSFAFAALIYITVRLFFTLLFSATDINKPIAHSFQLTKKHVLSLAGLLLALALTFIVIGIPQAVVSYFIPTYENSGNALVKLSAYAIDGIIQILTHIITTAAAVIATVKAYWAIGPKDAVPVQYQNDDLEPQR